MHCTEIFDIMDRCPFSPIVKKEASCFGTWFPEEWYDDSTDKICQYVLVFNSSPAEMVTRCSIVFGTGSFRSHAFSFPGTKLPSNIRSHKLSSTTVALLGRRSTRYSIHHYELFN